MQRIQDEGKEELPSQPPSRLLIHYSFLDGFIGATIAWIKREPCRRWMEMELVGAIGEAQHAFFFSTLVLEACGRNSTWLMTEKVRKSNV